MKIQVLLKDDLDIEEIYSEEEVEFVSEQSNLPPFIEELKWSIINLKLDEPDPVIVEEKEEIREEMKEEAPPVILREFKFADLFAKVEEVINTKEDVKPWDVLDAVWESVYGTNAQKVCNKFFKKFKKGGCGPIKAIKKAMKKAKEHAKKEKKRMAEQAQIPVD